MERSQEHTLASRSPVRSLAGYRIQVVHPTLHTQAASTVSRVGKPVSTAVSRVATTQVGSRHLVSRHLVSRHLVRKVATPEARGAPRDPVRNTVESTVVHGRLKGLRLRKPVMAQHLSNLDTVARRSRQVMEVRRSTRASRTQDRAASPGMAPRHSSPATEVRRSRQVASVVLTQVCPCRKLWARRLRDLKNLRRREQASLGR